MLTKMSAIVCMRDLEMYPRVKLFDQDDKLSLFCYDEWSSDMDSSCRGMVFDKETDKLLFRPYSYTPEYTLNNVPSFDLQEYTVLPSYEGTLIRVFYHDKWYISTNKKLDAFQSKWGSSVSFGKYFCEALEYEFATNPTLKERILQSTIDERESILDKFLSTLDKQCAYFFLLKNNTQNRLVSPTNEISRIYHVGTCRMTEEPLTITLDGDIGVTKPQVLKFKDWNDLSNYITYLSTDTQGLIFINNQRQFKIFSDKYKYYYDLRANNNSIKYRYLELRSDPEKRLDFVNLYPERKEMFERVERRIEGLCKKLLEDYCERYIRKLYNRVPREEHNLLKQCHEWHCSDRQNNKISIKQVRDVVSKANIGVLYKLTKVDYE